MYHLLPKPHGPAHYLGHILDVMSTLGKVGALMSGLRLPLGREVICSSSDVFTPFYVWCFAGFVYEANRMAYQFFVLNDPLNDAWVVTPLYLCGARSVLVGPWRVQLWALASHTGPH